MQHELADYIFQYCYMFYNEKERKAKDHHLWRVKYERYDDRRSPMTQEAKRNLKSNDPEVLALLADGYPAFVMTTATRVFHEHKEELNLNYCPQCGGIARTPLARQCRFCGYDWH